MRSRLIHVFTAGLLCHLFLAAPLVTRQALAQQAAQAQDPSDQSGYCHLVLTAPPASKPQGPEGAKAAAQPPKGLKAAISEEQPVEITARECEKKGDVYSLRGEVDVHFGDYSFHGESVSYDYSSGNASAEGPASFDGGLRDFHLSASHATYNVRRQAGKFYDVTGTTGARFTGRSVTLTSSSPITFTGRMVEQTGPDEFMLHHGSVTSCELPHPKWTFNAEKIILRVGGSAQVYSTTFRIRGVPVIFLPYVAHPVEQLGRQTGFLIPNVGTSSSKGTIFGDSLYWAINRSTDATLGGEYLSKRGWLLNESFRARPSEGSFVNMTYFQVLDRGIAGKDAQGNPSTVNQGGEDIKLNGEAAFAHGFRGVASLNYLSSFAFRAAFTENFSQAVDSEVKSVAFLSKAQHGFLFNAFGSRYQNFQSSGNPDDVITILHTPGLGLASVDQQVFKTPFYWSYDLAAEGLRRSEQGFVTPGVVGRFDIDPDLSLPVFAKGWMFRPEVDLRNTVYTQQQSLLQAQGEQVASKNVLNRRTIGAALEIRPPTLVRVFDNTFLGRKVKHTVEPRLVYRYSNGVESFGSVIHFDYRDILSNTNELEFGVTQRLFLKHKDEECSEGDRSARSRSTNRSAFPVTELDRESAAILGCTPAGANEFLSWEVKAKYFADPSFGGAIINGRRNVLATTVDFAGIAFLTDPRLFSPVVSKVRMRTTGNSDLQWQIDYDTKKGRINSSTFYSTLHFGDFFVEASHAYLQVPGEIVRDPNSATGATLPFCTPHLFGPTPCVPLVFNQFRALVGYGSPSKRGWSIAAQAGVDSEFNLLQYSAAQTAYNWDCCGLSFEYRRFSLGSVRNENQYRFAFTLANIGSFGNLKRQARLF
jgi:LPS-assembly protein